HSFPADDSPTSTDRDRKRGVNPPRSEPTPIRVGGSSGGYSPCFRRPAGQRAEAYWPKTGAVPGAPFHVKRPRGRHSFPADDPPTPTGRDRKRGVNPPRSDRTPIRVGGSS